MHQHTHTHAQDALGLSKKSTNEEVDVGLDSFGAALLSHGLPEGLFVGLHEGLGLVVVVF